MTHTELLLHCWQKLLSSKLSATCEEQMVNVHHENISFTFCKTRLNRTPLEVHAACHIFSKIPVPCFCTVFDQEGCAAQRVQFHVSSLGQHLANSLDSKSSRLLFANSLATYLLRHPTFCFTFLNKLLSPSYVFNRQSHQHHYDKSSTDFTFKLRTLLRNSHASKHCISTSRLLTSSGTLKNCKISSSLQISSCHYHHQSHPTEAHCCNYLIL